MISVAKNFTIYNTYLLSSAQLSSFREIRLPALFAHVQAICFELKQHCPTYPTEVNNYIIITQNSDSLPHLMLLGSSILISL